MASLTQITSCGAIPTHRVPKHPHLQIRSRLQQRLLGVHWVQFDSELHRPSAVSA